MKLQITQESPGNVGVAEIDRSLFRGRNHSGSGIVRDETALMTKIHAPGLLRALLKNAFRSDAPSVF